MEETKHRIAEYYALNSELTIQETSEAVEQVFSFLNDFEAEGILKSHGKVELRFYLISLSRLLSRGMAPALIKEFCENSEAIWNTIAKMKDSGFELKALFAVSPFKSVDLFYPTEEKK